jgi:hypothetical protein
MVKIRKWMRNELTSNTEDYLDTSCNVLNATLLAEAADAHFYPDNQDNPSDDLFEIAAEEVETATVARRFNR